MSNCWKCNKVLEHGELECSPPCRHTTEPESEMIHFVDVWREIDWDKVDSIADIKLIISTFGMAVRRGSPQEEKLMRFLK